MLCLLFHFCNQPFVPLKFSLPRLSAIRFASSTRRGPLTGMLDSRTRVHHSHNSWLRSLNFSLFDLFYVDELLLEFHSDMIFCLLFSAFVICVLPHSNLSANFMALIPPVPDSWITSTFSLTVRHFLPAVGSLDSVKETLALSDTAGNLVSLANGFLVEPWPPRLSDPCLHSEQGRRKATETPIFHPGVSSSAGTEHLADLWQMVLLHLKQV